MFITTDLEVRIWVLLLLSVQSKKGGNDSPLLQALDKVCCCLSSSLVPV